MQLKEFKKTKLSEKDLEKYQATLNEFYKKKTLHNDQLFIAKNKLLNEEITKDTFKQMKAKNTEIAKEFTASLKSTMFKDNLKNATKVVENINAESPEYLEANNELTEAKRLYEEFQLIVKEKGRSAKVVKFNNLAIEVENLHFRYNPEFPLVLKNVNFTINHGEYIAIIGHNGSGKSTLSKILIGVLTAEKGIIKLFGNVLNSQNIAQIRQFLGIVFQNPDNQFIGSTVRADIAFGLENKRIEPKEMPGIIQQAAEKVHMEEFLDHEPLNLSGGQKQRVAIASALALNPDILIFDEATSMLDPKGKREVKEIMVNLRNQRDKTILSITHDMDEILNADKVLVMNNGELVRYGTPQEVINDEGFLESIHLGVPFIAEVENELIKAGIKLNKTNSMDDLVKQLWKK
ncbi:cobalt ABC transporter ATP-binding subunit [Williamsoniiplasma luminosum]|uniref:Cobalt ABC transporter ATP-binding subunit n=1 Tax=Williamsoniiplasma luminosum TaxID=214888 RepID=A0A2K8NWN4_9MOLU|nr:energy-coupling factor transporter ATPase [Williamsoniiplasma luminosum]ATZ17033.1 cobalt ABC transporter ATP-binding subunit [Williamsoniiplasma luminosum]AVP49697.1 MAG: energy-coupling factor transporter ATPase [Williamsoniiplasma luminosum]